MMSGQIEAPHLWKGKKMLRSPKPPFKAFAFDPRLTEAAEGYLYAVIIDFFAQDGEPVRESINLSGELLIEPRDPKPTGKEIS